MGKQIYLTDDQIELLRRVLAPENFSCETEDEEHDIKMYRIRDQLIEKLQKRG